MISQVAGRVVRGFVQKRGRWILALALVLLAVGCGPSIVTSTPVDGAESEAGEAVPAEATSTAVPVENGYPAPPPQLPQVPEEGYPVAPVLPPTQTPFPDVYPPPAEVFQEPRFRFDLPLQRRGGDGDRTGSP